MKTNKIVALFADRSRANAALEALKDADFVEDEYGVFIHDNAVDADTVELDDDREQVMVEVTAEDVKIDIAKTILKKSQAIQVDASDKDWSTAGWQPVMPAMSQ